MIAVQVVEIGRGYVYLWDRSSVDGWGDVRLSGTMFDTVAGTVQPRCWFTGPAWMEPCEMVKRAAWAAFEVAP